MPSRVGRRLRSIPPFPTHQTPLYRLRSDQKYLPYACVSCQGCKEGYPVVECEYKAGHQQAPNPGPIWDFVSQF